MPVAPPDGIPPENATREVVPLPAFNEPVLPEGEVPSVRARD